MSGDARTLLLGWGNPGRGDDGLGPALATQLGERRLDGVETGSDYQLQVEDAAAISEHDRVVFVDADRSGPAPFSCRRLGPASSGLSFTSHSVSPSGLLTLARELFGAEPEAWLVGVRGYEFDKFHEGLSHRAAANLDAAVDYLGSALTEGRLREVSPPMAAVATNPNPKTDRESAP